MSQKYNELHEMMETLYSHITRHVNGVPVEPSHSIVNHSIKVIRGLIDTLEAEDKAAIDYFDPHTYERLRYKLGAIQQTYVTSYPGQGR